MSKSKEEVLAELVKLKDTVLALKSENQSLKAQYNQLKTVSDNVQAELVKVTEQNGFYHSDIENLQAQLKAATEQNQQSQQAMATDAAAKDAFMQEMSRILDEANKALTDEPVNSSGV